MGVALLVARVTAQPARAHLAQPREATALLAMVAPELGERHLVREVAGDVIDLRRLVVDLLGHESYIHCTTDIHNRVNLGACSISPPFATLRTCRIRRPGC